MLTQSASLTAYMIAPCDELLRIMLQTSLKCTELSEPYRTASVCAAAIHLPLFGDSDASIRQHIQTDDDHGRGHGHPGQRHCAVALRNGLPGLLASPLRALLSHGHPVRDPEQGGLVLEPSSSSYEDLRRTAPPRRERRPYGCLSVLPS